MRKITEIAACILLAGATILAVASEPQIKVAATDAAVAKAAKPAKAVVVKPTEAVVHDYRLERESCCGPQN